MTALPFVDPLHCHLAPECPWRPPDWRWHRAALSLPTCEDEWCERLTAHQTGMPPAADAAIIEAHAVRAGDPLRRAEIEARILADQPPEEIARLGRLSVAAVGAFEALFFDVRPRLGARGWIIYDVIGLEPWGPLKPHDIGVVWAYLGFLYGPFTVEALVAGADRQDLEKIGLPVYWATRSQLPRELQFLLLSRSLPESGKKALQSLTRLIELGLCEMPPYVVPPPKGLALDLSVDIGSDLASWDEQSDLCDTAAVMWEAQAA